MDGKFNVDDLLAEYEKEQKPGKEDEVIESSTDELSQEKLEPRPGRKVVSKRKPVSKVHDYDNSELDRLHICLPKELITKLKHQAIDQNVSVSYLIADILKKMC